MNDVWLLDTADTVETLSSQFWGNYAKGCSLLKNLFLLVRYDDGGGIGYTKFGLSMPDARC